MRANDVAPSVFVPKCIVPRTRCGAIQEVMRPSNTQLATHLNGEGRPRDPLIPPAHRKPLAAHVGPRSASCDLVARRRRAKNTRYGTAVRCAGTPSPPASTEPPHPARTSHQHTIEGSKTCAGPSSSPSPSRCWASSAPFRRSRCRPESVPQAGTVDRSRHSRTRRSRATSRTPCATSLVWRIRASS